MPSQYPGVRVIDGFSNQRPWDHGTPEARCGPGSMDFSRHFYTALNTIAPFNGSNGVSNPSIPIIGFLSNVAPINAIGQYDGTPSNPSNPHSITPGNCFIPTFTMSCPEAMYMNGAKALLRLFTFYSHKGVETACIFAARDDEFNLSVIPEAFFTSLLLGCCLHPTIQMRR